MVICFQVTAQHEIDVDSHYKVSASEKTGNISPIVELAVEIINDHMNVNVFCEQGIVFLKFLKSFQYFYLLRVVIDV